MNLIFHIFSAMLGLGLAWYLIRLQAEAKFSRELIAGARDGRKQIKIFVDTPYRFLKRFTGMMEIDFEHDEGSLSDSQLVKIDGSALLKLCLENGVTSIKMRAHDKNQITLGFSVNTGITPADESFAAVFNGKLQIEIVSTNR